MGGKQREQEASEMVTMVVTGERERESGVFGVVVRAALQERWDVLLACLEVVTLLCCLTHVMGLLRLDVGVDVALSDSFPPLHY